MPTIVHFDVPVDDMERASRFYRELLDWKIEAAPGPMPYSFIATADDEGEEGLGGGMGLREDPGQQITMYAGVSSVDEYAEKVEALGGKVVTPKMTVPGFGYLAVCVDTEGNTFGLWQVDRSAGM